MPFNENGPSGAETAGKNSNGLFEKPGPEKKPSEVNLTEAVKSTMDPDVPSPDDTMNQYKKPDPLEDNDGDFVDSSERLLHERRTPRGLLDRINQLRFNCGMFVNNKNVQFAIVILISINAIMIGIGTYDFVRQDEELDNIFETVDFVFLIIFTVELFLQFIYHGWRLLLDGWLIFDLAIILTSWSFSSVQIIRAFRIFRALRLVTRIKIMKNLILALFGVVPRMAAIGLMLALIFYIFAVMFTQLFDKLHVNEPRTEYNYFGDMGWTLFTLFQMMTLDEWASICREVMVVHPWAWLPFIAFVIISGFIIVNLIIAVICDAIASLHQDAKAKLQGNYDDGVNSQASAPMEIREQLDCLDEQMEELTRVQARTFHTLQYLTRQMQMHKLKKELAAKNSMADAARNLKKVQRELSQTPASLAESARAAADEDATDDDGTGEGTGEEYEMKL